MEVLDMKALGKALAFVIVLALMGAGTATAAKMITGGQIVNGTVTGADLKNGTVKNKDLSAGAKAALTGPAGPEGPAGPAGPAGSADRYAAVRTDGLLIGDVKGIEQAAVHHAPGSGIYCFTLPGPDRPRAGAANGTAVDTFATLQIAEGSIPGCPVAATVRVVTWDLSDGTTAPRPFRLILEND
jgi:hypothetical protein